MSLMSRVWQDFTAGWIADVGFSGGSEFYVRERQRETDQTDVWWELGGKKAKPLGPLGRWDAFMRHTHAVCNIINSYLTGQSESEHVVTLAKWRGYTQ